MPNNKGYRKRSNKVALERTIEFWGGLRMLGFVPHEEWYRCYYQLEEPRDRIAALTKLLEYGLLKPSMVEDSEESSDNIKGEASYDLLKSMMTERLKNECQQNLLQQSPESQQASSVPQLLTAQLKQN